MALLSHSSSRSRPSTTDSSTSSLSRQEFWSRIFKEAAMATAAVVTVETGTRSMVQPANAASSKKELGSAEKGLSGCPGQPVKKSCWSSEDKQGRKIKPWQPPSSIAGKQQAIVQSIEETINEYPQRGQNDVDKGGWKQVENYISTTNGATYIRYEFTSGKFKYIDDLEFIIYKDGKISIRTASRNGGFDYNVNATRINYIAKLLEKKGWTVKLV